MCRLVTVGKHVNIIRVIARQLPVTTIEGLLETLFSVTSAPRLYKRGLNLAALKYTTVQVTRLPL
jgi:hypothetical protein